MGPIVAIVAIVAVIVFIIFMTQSCPNALERATHSGYFTTNNRLYITQPEDIIFRPIQFSNDTNVPSRVDRHSSSPMSDARR
jgi:hypothetical protein